MCLKISLATTIFTLFLTSSTAAPLANAAPAEDACALLTQAQVSAAVGFAVGAGSYVTPNYVKTCTFKVSGDSAKTVSAVTISYQDANSFAAAKSMMEMAKARMTAEGKAAGQLANDSVTGIGDDAFYTTVGTGYTGLLVKKGNVSLKVAIYGDLPADKKKAMEKTLTLQALSKP